MAGVRFERIYKLWGQQPAVEDLTLEIQDGEFLVLVGPSGCGKTTSLRMLAGLERPTYGKIFIGERLVNRVPSKDRNIAMVFQSYALYPHMSAYDNLAFGMRVRREPKEKIARQVEEVAGLLNIAHLLKRRPSQLSGGERQRVALGRALLRQPEVFLMDEPLSNLDAALRVQMRAELSRLHLRLGVTTVYVTHDQVEAMTMGDRIAVMSRGRLQQVAPPETLYDEPANLFVAGFIGSPRMNLVPGRLGSGGGRPVVEALGERLPLPAGVALAATPEGGEVVVGIRPEDVRWRPEASGVGLVALRALVDVVEPLGSEAYVTARVGETSLVSRFPPRTGIREGETVELAVDPARLHLFDARTQQTLLRRDAAPPARQPLAGRAPE